jgi:Amt family ammonium transporter
MVFLNTFVATAAAACAWTFCEWITKGSPTMLGGASGAIAGLVAITPACGFVGPMGAIAIGILAGLVCLWAVVWLKHALGYDDSLDVFGVHCVGGILGALLTGIFASPSLGGQSWYDYVANAAGEFDMGGQMVAQLWGVGLTVVWSAVVSVIAYKVVDMVVGLRVSEDQEREGLDTAEHHERAYTA